MKNNVNVLMCSDPVNTMCNVSCCVEPSQCFKNSYCDAIANLPQALPLKGKSGKSYKCLFCHIYAFTQRFDSYTFTEKPRSYIGKSFTLKLWEDIFSRRMLV